MEIAWTYLYLVFNSILELGLCVKCYNCDTRNNPACGVNFKSYQFDAAECKPGEKCGLQRQEPLSEKDNFVGILRKCYTPGDLPGINETDGCRYWTIKPHNFTAMYCFCSENYCNKAPKGQLSVGLALIAVLGSLLISRFS